MKAILALLFTLISYFLLFKMEKKKINFGIRTLLAFGIGIVIGLIFKGHTDYVSIFGQIFTRLINLVVAPLIFFSIIANVLNIEHINRLKSLGGRSVFWLLLNTLFASTITVFVVQFLKLGQGFNLTVPGGFEAREVPPFMDTLVNFVPKNFFEHMGNNQIIPVIVFSIMIGIALLKLSEKENKYLPELSRFFQGMNDLIFEMVKSIIKLTPYAVLSYIASAITRDFSQDLSTFVVVILVAYGIAMFQAFIVHGSIIAVVTRRSPLKFFKAIWPAQVVAFSSQSSIGTVPVTIKALVEDLKVDKDVAAFVAGLGSNIGMPACAGMWPTLLALFSINALNIPFAPSQYIILIAYTLVVALGTAGVPGTATITATAVLAAMGLPIETVLIMAPISSLVDMGRTMTNVTGAATAAYVVAHREGAIQD